MKKILAIVSGVILAIGAHFTPTAQAACTNVFPTSLNNYTAGACIPSAWGNALESAIGITGSSVTSSLEYLVAHVPTSSVVGLQAYINSFGFVTSTSGSGGVTTSSPFTSGNIVVASGSSIITTSSVFYLASNPNGYTSNVGTVTTSSAVTANYFPFWNATNGSGLNGTSTLSVSGVNTLNIGTSTSGEGNVQWKNNATGSYLGIWDTSTGNYYGISPYCNYIPGFAGMCGYYQGVAIQGNSNTSTNPIFGVLNSTQESNGLGHTAFTIQAGNQVYTFNNTLDNGTGSMVVSSTLRVNGTISASSSLQVNGSLIDNQGNKYSTSTSSGSGTVTTSTAFTSGNIPIINGASSIGNSSLSQAGGVTLINGGTAILDAGGDIIAPNIYMTTTSTVVVGNFVQGGGVETFNTTTTVSGAQFCSGGLINIQNTTGSITIQIPTLATIAVSPCGPSVWASDFAQQYMVNNSTNTVYSAINGAGESQEYSPGTPTSLAPGQEWFITGQFEASTTIQGATSTGMSLVVKYQLEQTSTPLSVNGNTISVLGLLQDGQGNKFTTSTSNGTPSPLIVSGNQTSTIFGGILSSASSSPSVILDFNNIQYVPQNFAQVGCAGNPAATTFQDCVTAIYESMYPYGGGTIMVTNDVTSTWTGLLSFNINGDQVDLDCSANVVLQYTGTSVTPSGSWLPVGQNIALNYNFGNPVGHARTSENGNCDIRGSSGLISGGQPMTATSTGIYFGGTWAYTNQNKTASSSSVGFPGAVGVNVDYNINGFGRNLWYGANSYVDSFTGSSSGGNCSAMTGCLLFFDVSSNSGERAVITGGSYTDPGNSTTSNAIYLSNGSNESFFLSGNSIDDAQLYCGASNALCNISGNNFEYSDPGGYAAYIPIINPSSDRSTQLTVVGNEFADDGTPVFVGLVKHGGQLIFSGNHIDMYGGGTTGYMVDHSNDNGVSSDLVCQNQVQGGTVTNIVNGSGGQTYSLATGSGCVTDNGNSYGIEMFANSNNVNDFTSGNNVVATFDHTGNWTLGVAGSSGSLNVQGNLNATGTISASSALTARTTLSVGTTTAPSYNALIIGSSSAANGVTGLEVTDSAYPVASNVLIGSIKASSYVEPQIWMGQYAQVGTSSFTNYIFNLDDGGGGTILNGPGTNNVQIKTNNNSRLLVSNSTGDVGIGTGQNLPSSTLQVVDPNNNSSTLRLGEGAYSFGCIEMNDSVNSGTLEYIYMVSGNLTSTTSKPNFCE
jgi:hypothetical protein